MRGKICVLVGVASLALFAYAGTASAFTLGIANVPAAGPTSQACTSAPTPLIGQFADDPNAPYHVPAGGGTITQWQTNTSEDSTGAAGAAVTFVVLAPAGGNNYTVVGTDRETLPNPLPANGIASYTLSSPMSVAGGDTLALYSTSPDVICTFNGATTPVSGKVASFVDPLLPPLAGQGVTADSPPPPGWAMNEEATLLQTGDAAVTTGAGPSGVGSGQSAVLFSTVTNNGAAIDPITFTDTVPSGLTIDSAVVGDGACAVSDQTVTCTTAPLALGQSVPVDIVVTPAADGSYTNTASVANASAVADPNSANNAASSTLVVGAPPAPAPAPTPAPVVLPPPPPPPPACVVPPLKGITAPLAKLVLKDLNCKAKVSHVHSKSVRKGLVVKSKPGKGTYANEKTVKLVVSSGRKA